MQHHPRATTTPTTASTADRSRWVLVTGGRSYADQGAVWGALDALSPPPACVLTGGAPGADSLAARWAHHHGVPVEVIWPEWRTLGRAAGPRRNAALVALKPGLVLVFPGGNGTADCLVRARKAGLRVWLHPSCAW